MKQSILKMLGYLEHFSVHDNFVIKLFSVAYSNFVLVLLSDGNELNSIGGSANID